MAQHAGLYYPLWRPEEIGISLAGDLVPFLKAGLHLLETRPEDFRHHEPQNGWGTLEHLRDFVRDYLEACQNHPTGTISTSR